MLCSMAAQAENPVRYQQLYLQTGLDQQMLSLWTEVDAEYKALQKKAIKTTADQSASASSLIQSHFSELALRKTIIATWQQQLGQSDIEQISQWLSSVKGKAITQAEIEAALSSDDEYATYFSALKNDPPSKARMQLLRQLDKAVHGSAASTDLGIQINLAAYNARLGAGLAPDEAISPAQQASAHEQDRSLIQAIIGQDLLRHNLFSYRDIIDDSLRDYIAFANSPSGQRFHQSTFSATRAALQHASQKLQSALAQPTHPAPLLATSD